MDKKLYRSADDRMIAGVCGGLGAYLDVDPVWIRLLFVLLLFASTFGFWAYLILWIIVPQESQLTVESPDSVHADLPGLDDGASLEAASRSGPVIVGVAFVLLGVFFLLNQFNLLGWLRWGVVWSLIIIGIGAALLYSHFKE